MRLTDQDKTDETMRTRDQLVQAVIADPDADGPREAFAAWGIKHGDLQGKLTRMQLDEARERRAGTTEAARRLHVEAYDLIAQHKHIWAREVLAIASEPQFYRGFVEAVAIDVPTFLARADELYSIAPIRSIQFIDAGPYIQPLAASPHIARLISIDFYNRSHSAALDDAGLRILATSSHLKRIAILSVPFNNIGIDGVEALAASKHLPGLRYVALGNNPVDDPTEQCGFDAISYEVNRDSITLPPLGRSLEAKYGHLRWLHAASSLRFLPPNEHDV